MGSMFAVSGHVRGQFIGHVRTSEFLQVALAPGDFRQLRIKFWVSVIMKLIFVFTILCLIFFGQFELLDPCSSCPPAVTRLTVYGRLYIKTTPIYNLVDMISLGLSSGRCDLIS